MIVNGKYLNAGWDTKIVEYQKGLTERLESEKTWLAHIGKLAFAQYKQFEADCNNGAITSDIRREYLKKFAEFFTLLKQPREIGQFDEVIEAWEKENSK